MFYVLCPPEHKRFPSEQEINREATAAVFEPLRGRFGRVFEFPEGINCVLRRHPSGKSICSSFAMRALTYLRIPSP